MKTRKILKIALLVIVAGIFIWTFVFLYQKSQPEVSSCTRSPNPKSSSTTPSAPPWPTWRKLPSSPAR